MKEKSSSHAPFVPASWTAATIFVAFIVWFFSIRPIAQRYEQAEALEQWYARECSGIDLQKMNRMALGSREHNCADARLEISAIRYKGTNLPPGSKRTVLGKSYLALFVTMLFVWLVPPVILNRRRGSTKRESN